MANETREPSLEQRIEAVEAHLTSEAELCNRLLPEIEEMIHKIDKIARKVERLELKTQSLSDRPARKTCPHCGRIVSNPNAQTCPMCSKRL